MTVSAYYITLSYFFLQLSPTTSADGLTNFFYLFRRISVIEVHDVRWVLYPTVHTRNVFYLSNPLFHFFSLASIPIPVLLFVGIVMLPTGSTSGFYILTRHTTLPVPASRLGFTPRRKGSSILPPQGGRSLGSLRPVFTLIHGGRKDSINGIAQCGQPFIRMLLA